MHKSFSVEKWTDSVFSGEQECAYKLSNPEDRKYDAKNMLDLMTISPSQYSPSPIQTV